MIVGSFFENDDDRDLMHRQHDVYHEALAIILNTCNKLTRFAFRVLNDSEHPDWGNIQRFDHRTLQGAHDFLAAAWRYSNDTRQGDLPFSNAASTPPPETRWLRWLETETFSLIEYPQLVRSVQLILNNKNKPVGYAAEASLGLLIMDRFVRCLGKAVGGRRIRPMRSVALLSTHLTLRYWYSRRRTSHHGLWLQKFARN